MTQIILNSILFRIATVVWLGFGAFSCTAITDFDEPEQKADLIEVLPDENVGLTINGLGGRLALNFSDDFPVHRADDIFALIGEEMRILVLAEESTVGIELTSVKVDTFPAQPGEFRVVVAGSQQHIEVVFYNGPEGEQIIASGEAYRIIIEIEDNPFMESGIYSFDVMVP